MAILDLYCCPESGSHQLCGSRQALPAPKGSLGVGPRRQRRDAHRPRASSTQGSDHPGPTPPDPTVGAQDLRPLPHRTAGVPLRPSSLPLGGRSGGSLCRRVAISIPLLVDLSTVALTRASRTHVRWIPRQVDKATCSSVDSLPRVPTRPRARLRPPIAALPRPRPTTVDPRGAPDPLADSSGTADRNLLPSRPRVTSRAVAPDRRDPPVPEADDPTRLLADPIRVRFYLTFYLWMRKEKGPGFPGPWIW